MYSTGHDPNNPNDTPDYGVLGFFGWACDDWCTWHSTLKTTFGKDAADLKWNKAWDDQSFWNVDYSFCKYEPAFHAYVEKEALGGSDFLADVGFDALATVNNLVKSIENTSTVIKWGVPILIGATIITGIIVMATAAKTVTPSMAAKVLQTHKHNGNGK